MPFISHNKLSYHTVLIRVSADFKPHSECKEIILRCKNNVASYTGGVGPLIELVSNCSSMAVTLILRVMRVATNFEVILEVKERKTYSCLGP